MPYTLTYLETASNLNNLLHAITVYERERLTVITEGSMRTQAYARADRSEIAAFGDEITTTYNALLMHYERFQGDDAVYSAYLDMTPVAVQSSLCALQMVRDVANSEADVAAYYAADTDLDVDTMWEQRMLAQDLRTFDFFLYGQACEMNATTLVQTPNIIN